MIPPRLLLAVLAPLAVAVPVFAPPQGAAPPAGEAPAVEDAFQQIFFAVLEGLYRDGVPDEVVDALLVENDDGGAALFVPGCGICLPALNALRVYRERAEITGFKTPFDTFGAGLSDDVVARCTSADVQVRFDALGALVERWVAARMDARRLTADERAAQRDEMEMLRKKGMAGLGPQTIGGEPTRFERCASCDAANDAFDRLR